MGRSAARVRAEMGRRGMFSPADGGGLVWEYPEVVELGVGGCSLPLWTWLGRGGLVWGGVLALGLRLASGLRVRGGCGGGSCWSEDILL
jgi:hypothetical protein